MRITHASLTLFRWEGIPPTRYNKGAEVSAGSSELGLLRLGTDAGIEGHALLGSAINPATSDGVGWLRFIRPLLIGADPMRREALLTQLWPLQRSVRPRLIGAVDIALWDIAGKAAGQPIHALLGTYRDSIGAYASSQKLDGPEAYAQDALAIRDRGWAAYKIHPPQEWRGDIACCEAVRRAVGDDYTLMLDSTWSYDYPAALRVGRAIEEMDYLWYEDPLGDEDIYGYVKLRQKLDIPIMATEYPNGGLDKYAAWITAQATDYLRGDVALKGGITACIKAAHLAEAFGMNYEVHHGGNSLNNVANLHLCMAIRNTSYFEVLLPDAAHRHGLVEEIEIGRDGLVRAPTKPGLGYEVDLALVERNRTAVLDG